MTIYEHSATIASMLKIRLQRVGRKHDPVFRVVLTESQNGPKSGKFNEILGSYDARDKNTTKFDTERISYWLSQGVQVSETVHNLLVDQKVIDGKKVNVLPKKSPVVDEAKLKAEQEAKEKAEAEAKAQAEAEAAPAEEAADTTPEEVPAEESVPAEPASTESTEEASTEPAPEETPAEETKEA